MAVKNAKMVGKQFSAELQLTLCTLWGSQILSNFISEINTILHFTQKFKMAAKSGGKTLFFKKSPVDSAYTLLVKNFVEITLSRSVSKINVSPISLMYQNFNLQFTSPLSSLISVLPLMLPLFGIHFLKTFVHHPLLPLLERSSRPISTQRLILLSSFSLMASPWC